MCTRTSTWKLAPRFSGRLAVFATLTAFTPVSAAWALDPVTFGDGEWLQLGAGLRISGTDDKVDGSPRKTDFNVDSFRVYVNGGLNNTYKFTLNTERAPDATIRVLDFFARAEFRDEFNIWGGRLLPPSDRANLDGPYYLSSYLYPGVVSNYPAIFAGRLDGATVWGKLLDKKLVYAVGIYNGHNVNNGASADGGEPLFAGRVTYDFWDAEDNPGYFTSSTYYGKADILALGVAAQYQNDAVGTLLRHGAFSGVSIDALMEKKVFNGGAVTLEGAFYHYGTQGVIDVPTNYNGASPYSNVGGLTSGNAFLLSGAFLFPQQILWGQIQPVVRYQQFDADLLRTTTRQIDGGVNYIIKGHNARISLVYSHTETTRQPNDNKFLAGLQVQF
jgi:hypothetical protein